MRVRNNYTPVRQKPEIRDKSLARGLKFDEEKVAKKKTHYQEMRARIDSRRTPSGSWNVLFLHSSSSSSSSYMIVLFSILANNAMTTRVMYKVERTKADRARVIYPITSAAIEGAIAHNNRSEFISLCV